VASEFLRSRVALTRELTFVVEWMLVAGLMLAMVLAYRLAHMIAFVGQPALGFQLIQTFWTILCYPAVVGALRLGLAFHKPAQGEIDSRGRRL
jgi:rod shape-determining protein MreD